MLWGLLAGLAAAVLYGVPAVLQAIASRRLPDDSAWRVLVAGARDPLMVAVVVLYLLGFGMHLIAIDLLPLYLAQSAIAASLLFTALAAVRVLGEWPHPLQWVSLAAVCLGLSLLAMAAGRVGQHTFTDEFTIVLYALFAVLVVLTTLAARLRGLLAGVLLGLLSGIAYAGTPLATRAIEDPAWDLRTVATALAVACFGVLGFAAYSLALQRARVTVATAPMILAQTVVPAVVGLVLLHDEVRPGWWVGMVVGLAISLLGAVGLAGVEVPVEADVRRRAPRPVVPSAKV
jgi:drug/metabolite transporter (DMT)-like permease